MPGGRRGTEVDPDDLDAAAQRMRQMAVRDFHASEDLEKALTARAGNDHIFGTSSAAKAIANKWDGVVITRVRRVAELGERTQQMAEDLERNADEYRRTEQTNEAGLKDVQDHLDNPFR